MCNKLFMFGKYFNLMHIAYMKNIRYSLKCTCREDNLNIVFDI